MLLGAGLDARAWRLDWPASISIIEVDSGAVEPFKVRTLSGPEFPLKASQRVFAKADISNPAELLAALHASGHDQSAPTMWVMEGLIGYLPAESHGPLLAALLAASAAGSRLLVTCPPTPKEMAARTAEGRPLPHVAPADPETTLARWGGRGVVK